MSEETTQPPDQPTRKRSAQGSRRTGSKRTQQATRASVPAQEATAPLAAPDTTGSAAPKALPAAETPAQTAPNGPNGPPIGECWGEFPPPERQAELTQRLIAWEQENNHGERPGPFAGFSRLTGADVFWLAARMVVPGYMDHAREWLTEPTDPQSFFNFTHFNLAESDLSFAHLQGAMLIGCNLQGAFLRSAQLQRIILQQAKLQGAMLSFARLEEADLANA